MRQEHETGKSFNELKLITQAIMLKKGRLNPTKRAFSERQITAFRDNSQASANASLKTEQANNSNLREEPSSEVFKPGLRHTPRKRGQ
ncbi:hypothetical protein [Helicobacter pylori]|uniref:hypothetical protein n=1 Tax=Helicobacter pylori TaxID=210 RepID=UPI00117AC314